MSQVKIRLTGLPQDVEAATAEIRQRLDVQEESDDYPNRNSAFVRRYLTVARKAVKPQPSADEPPILQIIDVLYPDGTTLLNVRLAAVNDMRFTLALPSVLEMDNAIRDICQVAPAMLRVDEALAASYDGDLDAEPRQDDLVAIRRFRLRYRNQLRHTPPTDWFKYLLS